MFIFEFIRSGVGKLVLIVILVAGAIGVGFNIGKTYQIGVYEKAKDAYVEKVVEKNETTQNVANNSEQIQVVYKDRIVTKYNTVVKEVIKYVEKENSNVDAIIWLNADWVRLHDNSTGESISETEITGSTSELNEAGETVEKIGVRSGKALEVIAENYKSYLECKSQLEGFQDFYTKLREKVNE